MASEANINHLVSREPDALQVFLVPIAFLIFTIVVRGIGDGDGVIGVMTLAGMLVMAIPLGAAVGAITVLLQRRWFV